MPRNAAGVYSLPDPPRVPNSVIDSPDENVTRDDIGVELTNSLDRNGRGGMLAPFKIADGDVNSPGLGFLNDPNCGLYRIGADDWAATAGGTKVMEFTPNTVTVTAANFGVNGNMSVVGTVTIAGPGTILLADGTAAAPSVAFTNDTDNGLFRIGPDDWALSCGAIKAMEFTPAVITIFGAGTLNIGPSTNFLGVVNISGNLITFGAGSVQNPHIQHQAATLDIRGGSGGGVRVLNNAASQVNFSIADVTGNAALRGTLSVGTAVGASIASAKFLNSNPNGSFTEWTKNNGSSLGFIGNGADVVAGGAAADFALNAVPGSLLIFATGNVERGRLTTQGYSKKSNSGAYRSAAALNHESCSNGADFTHVIFNTNATPFGMLIAYTATPNSAGQQFLICSDGTAQRFIVRSDGGLANFSANNVNLSDAGVKEYIQPLAGADALELWKAHRDVEWCSFKYRDQTHDDPNFGYVAQDIEKKFANIAPWLVEGDKYGKKWVYNDDLHNIGHAVLSEAQRRIEALEGALAKAGITLH